MRRGLKSCLGNIKVQGFKSSRVQEIELPPNGQVVASNIPSGQWHTVRTLESGSVILEMKEGAYEPTGPEDILVL